MICRWCGEKLDPGQPKCPACGRRTEPASACGGFFDLAPGLEQRLPKTSAGDARPGTGTPTPSPAPSPAGGGRPPRRKRRRAWWLWPVSVAVLAVALAVMSVLYFGARAELSELQTEPPAETVEPTEAPIPTSAPSVPSPAPSVPTPAPSAESSPADDNRGGNGGDGQ